MEGGFLCVCGSEDRRLNMIHVKKKLANGCAKDYARESHLQQDWKPAPAFKIALDHALRGIYFTPGEQDGAMEKIYVEKKK